MQHRIKIGLVVGVAATALAGSALAGPNTQQTISMKLSPSKAGTKKKPRNVKLTFEAATSEPDGTQPPVIKEAAVYFPKGLRFNPSKFPVCPFESLAAVRPDECPGGSKVGGGSATAVSDILQVNATPQLTLYNGERGNTLTFYAQLESPIYIRQAFEGKLSKGSGAYPHKLTLPIPENLQQPIPGIFASITKFAVSVYGTAKKRGKKYGYIETVSCPRSGKHMVKGVFTTIDGQVLTATSSVRCS